MKHLIENNTLHKWFGDVMIQLFIKNVPIWTKDVIVGVLVYWSLRESSERGVADKFVPVSQSSYVIRHFSNKKEYI